METKLDKEMKDAIWVGESLFFRGKVSGSAANLSFKYDNKIYITTSGSCFGRLDKDDFSILSMDGTVLNNSKPSKEWPLHLALYQKDQSVEAVIHTHSTYATYWSCQKWDGLSDLIPTPTPYLKMKVGVVGFVPYAHPGSAELFRTFENSLNETNCYLLENHGPILADKTMLDAFYAIEELEEAAQNAYLIKTTK
jgi:3-dehydro-4-phosphotetronate decarboxylase